MAGQMRQNSWHFLPHSQYGSQICIAHSIFIYVSLWFENKVVYICLPWLNDFHRKPCCQDCRLENFKRAKFLIKIK